MKTNVKLLKIFLKILLVFILAVKWAGRNAVGLAVLAVLLFHIQTNAYEHGYLNENIVNAYNFTADFLSNMYHRLFQTT